MDKYKLFILLFTLSCILVTVDLITTRIGLLNPSNYELNYFGNNPYIEYPVILSCLTFIFLWENHYNLGHKICACYTVLPLIAIINNIIFILRG